MGKRALKRHVQQELGVLGKKPDKNGQFRGARKGEKREGVGRPKQGARASERHEEREVFRANQPLHVIVRAAEDIRSLRTEAILFAIREALITVGKLDDFRVIHFSVQRTHVHFICEAAGRRIVPRCERSAVCGLRKRIGSAGGSFPSSFACSA